MTYVVVHFIEKVSRLHWIVLLFPFCAVWLFNSGNPLWLSLNNVFMGVYFFYLGRLWHELSLRASLSALRWLSLTFVVFFVVGNALFGGSYTMSTNLFEGNAWLVVLNMSFALCGIAGFLLSLHLPRIPLINFIGEHSMAFFVLHYPMLYFYKFVHLSFGRSIYGRWNDLIVLLPVIFGLCSWLVPYFERVPWLSGRWNQGTARRTTAATSGCP